MNKVCLVIYHKNAFTKYGKKLLDECFSTLKKQTYQDFDIVELNFGGKEEFISDLYFENKLIHKKVLPDTKDLGAVMSESFQHAKNLGYQYLANVNIDDIYDSTRLEQQVKFLSENPDFDAVTSNFCVIDYNGMILHKHFFHNLSIEQEFARDHNIIGCPVIMLKNSFFDKFGYFPSSNIAFGREDYELWKVCIEKNGKIKILEDNLFYYRSHENKFCNTGV